MQNVQVVTSDNFEALKTKIEQTEEWNKGVKLHLIKAIENLDIKRDSFKIKYLYRILLVGYFSKEELDAINKMEASD